MSKVHEAEKLFAETSIEEIEFWLVELVKHVEAGNKKALFTSVEVDFIRDVNAQYDDRLLRGFSEYPLSRRQIWLLHRAWQRYVSTIVRALQE